MDAWRALMRRADRQGGYVAVAQAVEHGVDPRRLRRRTDLDGGIEPHPGVIGLPGCDHGFVGRVWAAVLGVGGKVLVGRRAAAFVHGMTDRPPAVIELVVPETRRAPRLSGVEVWRSKTLLRRHATKVKGLPVTTPARTLVDLAAVLSVAELRAVVIDAVQRRIVSHEEVLDECRRLARAPGARRLRQVLRELDAERCDSVFEAYVRRDLRRFGFRPDPAPCAVQAGDRTLHVDIPWSRFEVGVETEGAGAHSSRTQLERDHRRRNRLAVHTSWLVLYLGWDRWQSDFADFLDELSEALLSRGAPVPDPVWRT